MERRIEITVNVNSQDHAEKIREDIERVIQERTTLYFISDPKETNKFIRDLLKEVHPEYFHNDDNEE